MKVAGAVHRSMRVATLFAPGWPSLRCEALSRPIGGNGPPIGRRAGRRRVAAANHRTLNCLDPIWTRHICFTVLRRCIEFVYESIDGVGITSLSAYGTTVRERFLLLLLGRT